MEIRKLGLEKYDNCNHEFEILSEPDKEKSIDGYYKDPADYKPGEFYKIYICRKCKRIVTVDYNIKDISPVEEFETQYKVLKRAKKDKV